MYVTCTVQAKGTRLAKPVLSLGLMCLAFLTGLNRVAEYRNHWSDVIAGFIIGTAIAAFLVRLRHLLKMLCQYLYCKILLLTVTTVLVSSCFCDLFHCRGEVFSTVGLALNSGLLLYTMYQYSMATVLSDRSGLV